MAEKENGFFNHPRIGKNRILRREYQIKIATKALSSPTLIVLPTGLGKTVVALIVAAERIHYKKGPILMMAPTKPLVEQHRSFMEENLYDVDVDLLTGETPPEKRIERYGSSDILVTTPQVVKNDILSGGLDISKYTTMIVDEAHRSVGDYPYSFISERFYESRPDGLVMGLTASPGHEVSRIYEVCSNLGIENIELRIDSDPDVKPYIQDLDVNWVKVEVSRGLKDVGSILERMYLDRIGKLQRMGILRRGKVNSIKELLGAASRIQEMIRKSGGKGGSYYHAMSLQAQAMKISHARELAETQGADALYAYMDRMLKESGQKSSSKATRTVVSDPLFSRVLNKTEALLGEPHPKVEAVERYVKQKLREDPSSRIIVFTHFRDTATNVLERLKELEPKGVKPVRFVGQASRGEDHGLNQKEQKRVLDLFREGEFNVLVATSVAEEGLDIPGADLVIFFEPIPSEIRTIQRRGRTGRHSAGKVIVLMSKETRDVAYSWSAKDKEMRMERQLLSLRRILSKKPLPEPAVRKKKEEGTLDSFVEEEKGPEIETDKREMPSSVVEELVRRGAKVIPRTLPEGDYILSEKVAVERKTVQDLSDSLLDGRLFEQVKRLRDRYQRPVLLVEGDDPFGRRNIKREALMGALSSICVDFNIPLMFTRDPGETAEFIIAAARREKKDNRGKKSIKSPVGVTLRSVQINILSSFPGISSTLAGRIMDRYGSLEEVFGASAEDLSGIEGIGKTKAKEIRGVVTGESVPDE